MALADATGADDESGAAPSSASLGPRLAELDQLGVATDAPERRQVGRSAAFHARNGGAEGGETFQELGGIRGSPLGILRQKVGHEAAERRRHALGNLHGLE